MKRDIAQFVAECDVCCRIKAEHQRPAGTLQPLSIPEWKWDKVGMDFITGFPKTQKGNDAIFVVIDRLSKVAHFLPVRESITASQCWGSGQKTQIFHNLRDPYPSPMLWRCK